MIPPLDVFSVKDNEPKWLGVSENLAQALKMARKNGAGLYFVFFRETGHKTMHDLTATAPRRSARRSKLHRDH